jgi:multiple sugar transport system permease protein
VIEFEPQTRGRDWRWTVAAVLVLLVAMFPFYWMVLTALRKESAVFAYPPNLLPTDLAPQLFFSIFTRTAVFQWLRNTVTVAGLSTLAVVPVAILAAHTLSRLRGRAVSMAALLILVTQMMPPVLLLVPYFIIFRELGLLDGLGGLILANFAWAIPVTAWLMKSAFDSVPPELEEAALVDGCGRTGALFRIAVPLAMPGLAAAAVFAFIAAWDEYFFARTLISNSAYWVVSVGLGSFTSDYSTSWQQIMAVATTSTLPPVILFLFVQKAFVESLAAGGLKG